MIITINNGIATLVVACEEDTKILQALPEEGTYRGKRKDGAIMIGDLALRASDSESAKALETIRSCLFRSGRLLRVAKNQYTAGHCRQCEKPVLTWWETETAVFDGCLCDGCAQKCEHKYEEGVAGNSSGMSVRQVCQKCNRCLPGESEKTKEQTAQQLLDRGIIIA